MSLHIVVEVDVADLKVPFLASTLDILPSTITQTRGHKYFHQDYSFRLAYTGSQCYKVVMANAESQCYKDSFLRKNVRKFSHESNKISHLFLTNKINFHKYVVDIEETVLQSFSLFLGTERLDFKGLGEKITQCLERLGLEYKRYLVGQGYDGPAVMSGRHFGKFNSNKGCGKTRFQSLLSWTLFQPSPCSGSEISPRRCRFLFFAREIVCVHF